jgi:hypothetical protein
LPEQKYQEPYTPATVTWMVFLIHSEIQYPAKVMKTSRPMTVVLEQLPLQAGFVVVLLLLLEGSNAT